MAKTTKTAGGNASGATAAKAVMAKTNGGGDRAAFARRPENIGQMEVTRPTGKHRRNESYQAADRRGIY